MLKFYQRLGLLGSIVLLCCLLALIGCSSSHVTPYYLPSLPASQQGDVDPSDKRLAAVSYRILLIGDAGAPKKDEVEPVLETLGEWAAKLPKKTSIVFLGDNMYPNGLIDDKQGEVYCRLGPQLGAVIENQAYGVFIPGNHDWDKGGEHGHSAVMAQEAFINKYLGAQSQYDHPAFLPEGGKPGPRRLELPTTAPVVRLVVLDTQWWLHKHQKPDDKDPKAVIAELEARLMTELPVIVVGHHPIETYGTHGEGRAWLESVGCSLLRWFKSDMCNQDVDGEDYKDMISQLNEAFSVSGKTSLLIYAAGHDHSLQVLEGRTADYLLVSGAGSYEKKSPVTDGKNTLFAHEHTGFMVVDFLENTNVLLRVVEDGNKEVQFHHWLKP